MSKTKERKLNLRAAAAEGARLVRSGKVNANLAAVLRPLLHQAKQTLAYRDDQLAKAAARSKK